MASKIMGITVEIGGDTTKLGKALKDVNSETKHLQTELKGVNTLLKHDPGNVTLLKQKYELLQDSIEETKNKLKILKDAEKSVQEQFAKGEITEEQYRDFQREIANTEIKLKSLKNEAKDFGSVFAQQCENAGKKMQDVGGKIEGVGNKLKGISTVSGAVLLGATKEAIDYETAWTGVTKTVDGTEEQLAEINEGIIDLSKNTASSAEDIAGVAESAGQLGIQTENILDFTETMVMLGDTTNLSADEASSALAKFANVTNMSADNYDRLGSTIVDLGNNFATTEADIVNMATRLASTGEITGLTEPQILALSTALSSAGIEAEAGGTAMGKLLKQLYSTNAGYETAKQAIDATGYSIRELQMIKSHDSDSWKALAQELGLTKAELSNYLDTVSQMNSYASTAGVSVEEFRKAYGEDAVGALSMFITGLNETERNGKSAVEILNEMGITEVRLSNAVLAMASSGDLMTNAIDTANGAWNENTALTAEAEKRYGTTESKLIQCKNAITEMCISLGDVLLPIVTSVSDVIKKFSEKLSEMSPTGQKVTVALLAIGASLSPLLITIGKVISSVGQILTLVPKIKTAITAVKTAFSAFSAVLSANPIGIVIIAITALIAIFVTLYNKCDWFREAVDKVWAKIKEGGQVVLDWFKSLPEKISAFVERVKTFFTETIPLAISTFITNVATWFSELGTKIWTAITDAFNSVKSFFTETIPGIVNDVVLWFQELPGKIWTAILGVVDTIAQWGANVKAKATEVATNAVNAVVTFFSELPYKIGYAIGFVIGKLVSWYTNIITWITTNVPLIIDKVITFFKELPGKIYNAITSTIDKIKTWGTNVYNTAKTFVLNTVDSVVTFFKELPGKIYNAITDTIAKIKEWGTKVKTEATNKVKEMVTNVTNKAKELPGKIKNAIQNAISNVKEWGTNVANTAKTKITDMVNKVISTAKELPGKIYNAIKSAVNKVATWCNEMKTKATTGVKNVATAITDKLKEVPNKVKTIGKNIVEGIWNGIKNATAWIKQKVGEFAQGILDGMKESLGIESPSKVFRDQVGKFISEGVGTGIIENEDNPISALETMSEDMTKTAQKLNGVTLNRQIDTTFRGSVSTDVGILDRLDAIVQKLERGSQIVLDTGVLVGETVNAMDEALGTRKTQLARGW